MKKWSLKLEKFEIEAISLVVSDIWAMLCVYSNLLFNISFLKIWEWAGSWGALAGCVGVLIRHNRIPLCPRASIKSALAASAGLSGPAGHTVGTSWTDQSRRVIKKYCVVASWVCVEFAEFWEKGFLQTPPICLSCYTPSFTSSDLKHLKSLFSSLAVFYTPLLSGF